MVSDNDDFDTVVAKLRKQHATSNVEPKDDGSDGRPEFLMYYADHERLVPYTVLRYLQEQGFQITQAGQSYLALDERVDIPERADRRVGYLEAKRGGDIGVDF